MSAPTSWQWWRDPANADCIMLMPNGGGGLAIFPNTEGEVTFRSFNFCTDEHDDVSISRHMIRAVVMRLIELCPDLVAPPKPLPVALLEDRRVRQLAEAAE